MNTADQIKQSIAAHLDSLSGMADHAATIASIVKTVRAALSAGHKVLTCGNGGSAAEALHLSEEMIGRFSRDREPFAALCLSADPTAITCISNDFGYEQVFARQVRGLGRKGDVLVALTTSGKSENIVRALESARAMGLTTIGLLGKPGSPAEVHCDIAFTPTASSNAHVQEMHLMAIHLILEQLDPGSPANC
ncbi:MAG: SIS domain-containing protein [Planctomycetes bacterium]|nr:SIS domain-containing protein [Planctomycetota bacterium]